MVGNGYCNDETNTAECNFDGGDCCSHCGSIYVTLVNDALLAQGSRKGPYHNSSEVNGKASWISNSQAIWYDQTYNDWKVGPLDAIGTSTAGIRSDSVLGCPFNMASEKWDYWYNSAWTSAGPDEIKFECLNGNLLSIHRAD